MANRPHPSLKAVTWRLPRTLLARVKGEAALRGETEKAFVERALTRELAACAADEHLGDDREADAQQEQHAEQR